MSLTVEEFNQQWIIVVFREQKEELNLVPEQIVRKWGDHGLPQEGEILSFSVDGIRPQSLVQGIAPRARVLWLEEIG